MRFFTFLSMIFLVFSCNSKMQRELIDLQAQEMISASKPNFPQDWLGYWKGDLHIYKESGKTMTIPMALDHAATDVDSIWTWAIVYGEDTIAGRRDYTLNEIDASKGHYLVDEKNSIFLDAFLLDNTLISTFKVAGNYLHSTYELYGDEILFTINFFPEKEVRITGDTLYNGEEIPMVYSYKNTVLQKARLKRVR